MKLYSLLKAGCFIQVFLCVISCSNISPDIKTQETDTNDSIQTINPEDIQGHWTTFGITSRGGCNGPIDEESAADIAEIRSWYINGDSIWIFRYPCAFYEAKNFRIKNDSVYFNNDRFASEHIKFVNGILVLTSVNCEIRNISSDTLELNTMNMLIKDSVNFSCLIKKMKLVTHSYVKGDGDRYELKFPISMPSTIAIPDEESARKIFKTKTITINTGGKEKLFKVTNIQWDDFDGNFATAINNDGRTKTTITLSPAEWWIGEPFTVTYEQD
jgi:hypothetical protein